MSERRPLKESIDARIDEARIHRVWGRVRAQERAPAPPKLWLGPVGIAAIVSVALWVALRSEPAAVPFLAMADGAAPTAVSSTTETTLRFADDSTITLASGASVLPRTNDAAQFGLELERGWARFSVTPGGPRRWSVDCGLAEIEVVGTVFTVERDDAHVRVSVERGRVHVTPRDGELRTLSAGESTEVSAPIARVDVPASTSTPLSPSTSTPRSASASTSPAPASAPAPAPPWRTRAAQGDYAGAYAALSSGGDTERSSADLLLADDVARMSGHPAEAIAPLTEVLERHADSADAPLAAIQLGRIEDISLHQPALAAAAYQRALALGVPISLDDDVRGRLARALHAAGDSTADGAARDYLARYPSGTYADDVRRWAEAPTDP
jgi:transmembrane sensor